MGFQIAELYADLKPRGHAELKTTLDSIRSDMESTAAAAAMLKNQADVAPALTQADIAWRNYGMAISGVSIIARGGDLSLTTLSTTMRGLLGITRDLATRGFGPLVATLKNTLSAFTPLTLAGAGVGSALLVATHYVNQYADALAKAREESTALGERLRDVWKTALPGAQESAEVARLTKAIADARTLATAMPEGQRGAVNDAITRLEAQRELQIARDQADAAAKDIQAELDLSREVEAEITAELEAQTQAYADQYEAAMRINNELVEYELRQAELAEAREQAEQEAIDAVIDEEFRRRAGETERLIEEGVRAIDSLGEEKPDKTARPSFTSFESYIGTIQAAAGGPADVATRQLSVQEKSQQTLERILAKLNGEVTS